MALTTNKEVWKIMIVLLLVIAAFFSTLFYFSTIFITAAIGFACILFTEKIYHAYNFKIKTRKTWLRRSTGILIALFWIISVLFLANFQINELSNIFKDTESQTC